MPLLSFSVHQAKFLTSRIRENARASITLCEVFIAGANHAHIYFAYVKTP